MKWYEYGDKQFAKLQRQIAREFRASRLLMPFDEINAMSINQRTKPAAASALDVRRECRRLYKRLRRRNHDCFLEVWLYVYLAWLDELERDAGRKLDPEKYVDMWLAGYDPVTKYVYDHEVERKEQRLFEAVLADGVQGNTRGFEVDYDASERLWTRMTKQYLIDLEDDAAKRAMKEADVKYVEWVTERDEKVCEECEALDGKVFRLENVPEKPHHNCRCTIRPWRRK